MYPKATATVYTSFIGLHVVKMDGESTIWAYIIRFGVWSTTERMHVLTFNDIIEVHHHLLAESINTIGQKAKKSLLLDQET